MEELILLPRIVLGASFENADKLKYLRSMLKRNFIFLKGMNDYFGIM